MRYSLNGVSGKLSKEGGEELEKDILDKINKFTRREFGEDELFVFSVILCDNDIDRDCERFSDNALDTLKKLFVGKTGIFDHDASTSNQNARIFDTEIVTDNERVTKCGEPYKYLKASAYMVRTDENKNLIAEIDGGIKKEVSISCSAAKRMCSVCGCDKAVKSCMHVKGKSYGGKVCHTVLDSITDAYEWSFVAVPSQRQAGVTKSCCGKELTMPRKKKVIPEYGTCIRKGIEYYRTRIVDSDGKRVSLYARTPEELYEKVQEAERLIAEASFRKENPTVNEYCEKWLLIQKGRLRTTTYTDYEWKVKKYIQKPLGNKYMTDVTPDDVNLAILPALSMSESVYRSTQMLYKLIFTAAADSNIINKSPCSKLSAKGGKPQKVKKALSDEQVEKLLTAIKDLPPYVFVMIGLYCGLRREEILALQWDCVFLDVPAPYLSVKRAWHTEHNRPVILDELKTSAAKRDIPIPQPLADCLKEVKAKSRSPFVVANRDGEPLSYTQFQRAWKYIVTRSNKERTYVRYVNGQKIKHTVTPVLGEKAPHNGKVVYSLDFQVTPHQLRHTYITNLIYAGVDPKTVQYLAGHENSKITMDIYAKVKYNSPDALSTIVNNAFNNMYAKAE